MELHSLSSVELKELAKKKRIKHYYIKKRCELITILSKPILPESFIVDKKTIIELREEAKVRGFIGISLLNRESLVDILYPHLSKKNNSSELICKK